MFAWAVTGSPFVDLDSDEVLVCVFLFMIYFFLPRHLQVSIVDESDELYSRNRETTVALMSHGVMSFKTCSWNVWVLAPYIAHLTGQQYPPAGHTEPKAFTQACEHWFLSQILIAIGSHTTL